ncbi:unnamed protein product, partial [Effrenium voratum]
AINQKVELHIAVPKVTLTYNNAPPLLISVASGLEGRLQSFLDKEVFPHFEPLWVRLDGLDSAPDGSSKKQYASRMLDRLTQAAPRRRTLLAPAPSERKDDTRASEGLELKLADFVGQWPQAQPGQWQASHMNQAVQHGQYPAEVKKAKAGQRKASQKNQAGLQGQYQAASGKKAGLQQASHTTGQLNQASQQEGQYQASDPKQAQWQASQMTRPLNQAKPGSWQASHMQQASQQEGQYQASDPKQAQWQASQMTRPLNQAKPGNWQASHMQQASQQEGQYQASDPKQAQWQASQMTRPLNQAKPGNWQASHMQQASQQDGQYQASDPKQALPGQWPASHSQAQTGQWQTSHAQDAVPMPSFMKRPPEAKAAPKISATLKMPEVSPEYEWSFMRKIQRPSLKTFMMIMGDAGHA